MDNLPLTAFDLIVLGVVALSALLALARGLTREVLSVLTWVGAFVVAYYGFAEAGAVLRRTIETDLVADGLALAIVFLVPLIVFKLVVGAVARLVQGSRLGSFDRTAGAAFGVARGALIVCLVYLGLSLAIEPRDHPQWIRDAWTLPYVQDGVELLQALVPEDLGDRGRAVAGEALDRARGAGGAADATRRLIAPSMPAHGAGEFGYPALDADALDLLIQHHEVEQLIRRHEGDAGG